MLKSKQKIRSLITKNKNIHKKLIYFTYLANLRGNTIKLQQDFFQSSDSCYTKSFPNYLKYLIIIKLCVFSTSIKISTYIN